MKLNRVVFVLATLLGVVSSYDILGMFITHSQSHLIIHMAVVRALVERGHNITVITSQPLDDLNPGYRHIFLKTLEVSPENIDEMVNSLKDNPPHIATLKSLSIIKDLLDKYTSYILDPNFGEFMKEGNHFDLMLLGYEYNEFQLGIAAHFRCPVVLSWMIQPIGHVSRLIGNPSLPAFVPAAPFIDSKPMDFRARVKNLIIVLFEYGVSTIIEVFMNGYYKKLVPPSRFPSLAEAKKNISLILVNHHFSEGPVRPIVPGLIEIGGIQIKDKPDPLPEDIYTFLENSYQGVILFSLGSYIRHDHFNPKTTKIVYKVLSSLPYNVIWKSESEVQAGNASNILFKNWFPQDDILAHRNLKLFITHGGKGSISESIYHGVPMIALPFFGDQIGNAESMQSSGYGVTLQHATLTEESFRQAVLDVLEGYKHRNAVQQFSRLYRDRPLSARESVVYWTEYVIRHRGAPHIQSPLKELNIIQEHCLDVYAFVVLVVYTLLQLAKMSACTLRTIIRLLGRLRKSKRD